LYHVDITRCPTAAELVRH